MYQRSQFLQHLYKIFNVQKETFYIKFIGWGTSLMVSRPVPQVITLQLWNNTIPHVQNVGFEFILLPLD